MKITKTDSKCEISYYDVELNGYLLFPRLIVDAIRKYHYDIAILSSSINWTESTKMLDNIIRYAYGGQPYDIRYDAPIIEYNPGTREWNEVPIDDKTHIYHYIVKDTVFVYPPPIGNLFKDEPIEYLLAYARSRSAANFIFERSSNVSDDYSDEPYLFKDELEENSQQKRE